ncbi:MAG TPA: hypothetical protein VFO93_01295 [Hymenobacter sp.]|uniref:hypothetical protein n=1 Tax=Hymenobacter sp. TaxID=1898978 RepID=UPI002D7F4BC4|nr:hypothetical protein [Hymenobacter sp.]HET9502145.1 hypothetical protein [Hymenobacter sp.]
MKRNRQWQAILTAALVTGLSSCFWFDENDTTELGHHYQVVATPDGNNFLYFEDPAAPIAEPLLTGINFIGTTATQPVVCKAGQYYLFPLGPATQAAVLAARIGPLSNAALRPKLYQVGSDSMLQLRPI